MSIKFRDERKRVVRLLRDGLEKLEAGDAAGALLEFESALLFDEDNVAASCLAAASLSRLGRSIEAEALALRAIELAPDFSFSHAVAAEVLFAMAKYSEAEAHLMEAVSIEPHNPGPTIELARFLILRDRPQEAGEHLRRSLEISPELAEARLLFAASLSQQGRWEDADLEIELVSRIRRVDATSLAVAAWLRMSRADDLNFSAPKLEEFKRALELLTTAHAIEPSNQLVQELLPICREAVERVGKPADAEFSPPSRLRQGLIALGLILYVVLFGGGLLWLANRDFSAAMLGTAGLMAFYVLVVLLLGWMRRDLSFLPVGLFMFIDRATKGGLTRWSNPVVTQLFEYEPKAMVQPAATDRTGYSAVSEDLFG